MQKLCIAQRPLRSRSRENIATICRQQQPRSATAPPSHSRVAVSCSGAGGSSGIKRRRSSFRSCEKVTVTGGGSSGEGVEAPRPAWINIVDGEPVPLSPAEAYQEKKAPQGLRRTVSGKENNAGSEGDNNNGAVMATGTVAGDRVMRGGERRGVSSSALRRVRLT